MDLANYGQQTYAGKRTRASDEDYTPPPLPVAYQQALEKGAQPNTASGNRAAEPAVRAPEPQSPTCAGVAKGEAPEPSHTPDAVAEITPDQVLDLLKKHQLISAADITRELRTGAQRVNQALAHLHRAGLAHRGPRGRWACAPTRQRAAEIREQIIAACKGRMRITTPLIRAAVGGNTKTIANRLAELAQEGVIQRISAGVYRDPAFMPPPEHDPMAARKTETIRAILRQAERPMTAAEIWQQDPQLFGGTDSTRVNALLLDQLQRGRVARYLPANTERPFYWYDPTVCTRPGEAEGEDAPIDEDATNQREAEGEEEDPILAAIQHPAPPAGVPPLPDHATQCRRLRGLAGKDVLDPIISHWLRDLARQIETQHRSAAQ